MKQSKPDFLKLPPKIKSLIDLAENTHFIQQKLRYGIKYFSQYLYIGNQKGLRVLSAGFCANIGHYSPEYPANTTTGARLGLNNKAGGGIVKKHSKNTLITYPLKTSYRFNSNLKF